MGVVAAGVLLLTLLLAAGVRPPGDGVLTRLGLLEDPGLYDPCDVSDRNLRLPAGPPAPTGGAWRGEPELPFRRDEPKVITRRGALVVVGGATPAADRVASLPAVLAFDPRSGSYRDLPRLPRGLDHAAAGALGGELVVAGGYDQTRASHLVFRLADSGGAWREASRLPEPRAAAGSAVLDGRLYVVGGTTLSSFDEDIFTATPSRDMLVYDPTTDTWTRGPRMTVPRHHLALVSHRGKLYALGGRTTRDFSADAVEEFDPATRRWRRLGPMPQGVGGVAAASDGRRIVVAGGGDDRERWVTPSSWSFDPAADRWTRMADLREPRHGHGLEVSGGRAYVFGGAPCSGFGLARSVESVAVDGPGS